MEKNSQLSKGFTLIELIVVILIIAGLLALAFVNFVEFRKRGRDGQRKADLARIQSALEEYISLARSYPFATDVLDRDGIPYPAPTPADTICSPKTYSSCPNPNERKFMDTGQAITYLDSVPTDPLGVDPAVYNQGVYYYSSDGETYTLVACLENVNELGPLVSGSCTNHEAQPCDAGSLCTSLKYYTVRQP